MSKKTAANGNVNRRTALRGVIGSLGIGLFSESGSTAQSYSYSSSYYGGNCAGGMPNDLPNPSSPQVTPFQIAMPVQPVMQPSSALTPMPTLNANTAFGEAPRTDHQGWTQFAPQAFYDVRVQEFNHLFHPQYPLQPVWGFNGFMPGPTIAARYGQPALVRFRNDLPPNHIGFGDPNISIHLHNAHTASESDGDPADFYQPGLFKDNHYANAYAGFSTPQFSPAGDSREALSTLWYHDHRVMFTAQNNYKGLAGFYLLFDNKDSGNENDTTPGALRLPSGAYDVPIIFHDKAFDSNGLLRFDTSNTDGYLGDQYLANGVIQPYFKVERRKYRFRLLNGGPSRFFQFFLSSGQNFIQISTDGNLLPAPIAVPSVYLGVANRMDVIIDFSQYKTGDQVFLQNRLDQCSGFGPTGTLSSPGVSVIRFDITGDPPSPDNSQAPQVLRSLPPVNSSSLLPQRQWTFESQNGAWTINRKFFDPNRVDAYVTRNTAEIWEFRNGFNWSHPIHVHLEEFQILSRNGASPKPSDAGRMDTVILNPGDRVKVYIQFRDWRGKYVMHCHNTVHEDHAMMIRFDVT